MRISSITVPICPACLVRRQQVAVVLRAAGEGATRASVEDSLRKLKTDYVDLMLLHQPFGDTFGAWRDLVKLYEEGKVRAVGISNFYVDRMVEFCEFNGIVPEAWAPFGEGRGGLFENETLAKIGAVHGKTAAQVMLRRNLQRGVVVIPKCTASAWSRTSTSSTSS